MEEWTYITDEESLVHELEQIQGAASVGIDTESDSFYHYRERVCLIQMTGAGGKDLIIDPLAIDDLSVLAPLMADPDVVKIFHGADYDLSSLKRDFGWDIAPIFDTMLAAQALGFPGISLADLVLKYFDVKLDKKYQRRDWSKRPLLREHIEYARLDSHFLPEIRDLLVAEVAAAGRARQVDEECRILEAREWTDHSFSPDDFLKIRGVGKLDEPARRILRSLCVLRDGLAEKVDRPHFKVMANDALLHISRKAPTTHDELVDVLGQRHHIVRRYSRDIVAAVKAGRADRSPLPRNRHDGRGVRRPTGPLECRTFNALRDWRNKLSEARGVQPGALISNALLQEIAVLRPKALEDLAKVPDIREWQREEFGEEIIEVALGQRKG